MENTPYPEAVVKSIVVRCSQERAFKLWTERIEMWWPKGHAPSGAGDSTILLEFGIGGRLYEKTAVGTEHTIGTVSAWNPFLHLAFDWYLGSGESRPSRVNIHFISLGANQTQIDLEHRGPELLGDLWGERIDKFNAAWDHILSSFQDAVQ